MKQRILSLSLAAALALSLSAPAGATWAGDLAPKAAAHHEWDMTPVYGSLSFASIDSRMRANNLTIQMMDETIKSMEDMSFDGLIDDLEDAIDEMESTYDKLSTVAGSLDTLEKNLEATLNSLEGALKNSDATYTSGYLSLFDSLNGYIGSMLASSQAASLKQSIESMESSLEDLEEQKKEYFEKTLPDTKAQMEDSKNQLIIAAEGLYLSILSMEQQQDALVDTEAATKRMVDEMTLRYERGQISQMTLTQVQNGYNALLNGIDQLELGLTTMRSTLQNLLGEVPSGNLRLAPLTIPSEGTLANVAYLTDLETAKEKSYSLYSAARALEDAEDEMDDARREEGKNSYQYKMAEHSYEAAKLSQQSAINSFELAFLNLYNQLAPAQAALVQGQAELDYQAQVYEVAKLKYAQGNLSANGLKDAEDTYRTAQRDFETLQMDLFTAWNDYQNAVEHGIVPTSG